MEPPILDFTIFFESQKVTEIDAKSSQNANGEEEEEEEISFIKSITLCSPWTELRVLLQFIKIFKLYITRLKNIKSY